MNKKLLILPDTRFLCETINLDSSTRDSITLSKYWRPKERLWRGSIPYSQLLFDPDEEIINDISIFFEKKLWNFRLDQVPIYNVQTGQYSEIENFIKMCWLTEEFFKGNGKFRNPLGSHYNPRIDEHVIHPGGCRNKIVKLFADKDKGIECWYFNTREIEPDWLKNLEPVNIEDILNQGFVAGLVPDHGSLIPHVAIEVELIAGHLVEYYKEKIYKLNIEPRQFSSNRIIESLNYWKDSKKGIKINFEFKSGASILDEMIALILFVVGKPFENKYLKVTIDES